MIGRMAFTRVLLLAALLAWGGAGAPTAHAAPQTGEPAGVSDRLARMVDDWFEEYLALNPLAATYLGDHRYDDRYPNWIGEEYRQARESLCRRYLERANALDRRALDAADRVTLDVFVQRLEAELAGLDFPAHLLPFDQLNSDPNLFAVLGSGEGAHPFRTVRDYDNFLSRIDDFLIWVDTAIANMRTGIETGVVQPRVIVERMIPQVRSQVVENPATSLFFQPISNIPKEFEPDDVRRLKAAYLDAISSKLIPAYRELADFLEGEYLPASRPSVGYDDLPGGQGWYDYLVAYHTTTDLTAAEILQLGLQEVQRIRSQMRAVMQRVGFEGDLGEFLQHLKTDPRYFWDEPEAVLADYRRVQSRVEAAIPALFGVSPRAGFEIRAVQPFRAESAAGASYESPSPDGSRPGIFYLNVWDSSRLAKWGMETLFLHEAIPGHHFQGALAQEDDRLPRFRRFLSVTAYTEGWALYAEDLGPELGMFEDPYQWFGKLNDEMLRAMRLVVDTGIHHDDWSRERAIRYMQENSSLADTDIVAEVERYIVDPGQALAYKVGQLRLRQLRADAQQALGDKFDLRAWHDLVLGMGEVPLGVLTAGSQAWVETQRRPSTLPERRSVAR